MLNCREATRLISQSMDARLPWHRRLAIRVHLLYCVWCRRYAAQLQFLHKATRELPPEALETEPQKLSNEQKEQMRARLQESLKNSPSSRE
jgi:cytochrome c-type biogenesis protein CcmH/NrfG